MKINGHTRAISSEKPTHVKGGTEISKDAAGNYTLNLSNKKNNVVFEQKPNGSWTIAIDGKAKLQLSNDEMKNLTVNGNGGNDTFTVKNGKLPGKLNINGGDGNDSLKLGGDPAKDKVVDKNQVNWQPGTRHTDRDSFEYYVKGPAIGGEGDALKRNYVLRREANE